MRNIIIAIIVIVLIIAGVFWFMSTREVVDVVESVEDDWMIEDDLFYEEDFTFTTLPEEDEDLVDEEDEIFDEE
ncbi:MAG TPA: hypothetical protein ENN31_00230 [Candidatus Vogelbacteria bacterium]|nr:hypothetical protein [Candidatus Vogelbacteria bacterium]